VAIRYFDLPYGSDIRYGFRVVSPVVF
jgi:hypothetical protein